MSDQSPNGHTTAQLAVSSFTRRTDARRARTPEQKEAVRQALIAAGRQAFSEQDYGKVSLRGIAKSAGYAPGVVYHYFADRHALLLAVREVDLAQSIAEFAIAAESEQDPARRLKKLLLTMLQYWRANPDQYEILFGGAKQRPMARASDGTPFSQSTFAVQAYGQYECAVRDYFDSLPRYPISLKLATDCLLVSLHGAIALPIHLNSLEWSEGESIAGAITDAFIEGWRTTALQA